MTIVRKNHGHGDLGRFERGYCAAKSDGKIDSKEAFRLGQAYEGLNPREQRLAQAMTSENKGPHRDAHLNRAVTANAFKDGQLDTGELKQIRETFENMEPREQARAVERLTSQGHEKLAASLSLYAALGKA